MGMVVLSDNFCTFSRNTLLPNFGNFFRQKYNSYVYKQGVIRKVIQFRKFCRQLFYLSVSSLFCVSCTFLFKNSLKNEIFQKVNTLLTKTDKRI